MNVLFHENQLGIRGTSVALYDYAHYNETLLGNTSYVAAPAGSDLTALDKFKSRFGDRLILYKDISELSSLPIEASYIIKAGYDDNLLIPGVKNIIHAVFDASHPHGDKYVAVSKWLGDKHNVDYLPHIVSLPDVTGDFREHLGFSKDDIVFGRYGGFDQFDVEYLASAVSAAADQGFKFLFMNTKPFTNSHANILYVEGTTDMVSKTAFINTCDAMLHGRREGESFGLAIAEFLHQNKPVFTNIQSRDRNHLYILKDRGFYYDSPNELFVMLASFKKGDYNVKSLVDEFKPEVVMEKFKTLLNG